MSPACAAGLLLTAARRAGTLLGLGDAPGHEFHGNQWKNVSSDERAVAEKLGLPTSYSGKDSTKLPGQAVDNPLPQSKQLDHEQTKRLPIMMMGEAKTVDISSLKSTQDYVQPSAVQNFKDGSYMKHQPIVATIHGDEVLLNGNHNVLAAKLRGEKTITVQHLGDFSKHADYIKEVDKGGHRMASRHPETALHAAADAHLAKMSVAVRYAFAMGRKAIDKDALRVAVEARSVPDAVVAPVHAAVADALAGVIRPALIKVVAAGGAAAVAMLDKQLRAASHKFASTQVNLPPDLAAKFAAFPVATEDLAADGREANPHITVKYGLVDATADDIRNALVGEPPFTVTLGKVATFEGVEDGTADAVIVEITSPALRRLNKVIASACETVDTHKGYKPHATIAYVKPGLGKKYAGDGAFVGLRATFDVIAFSGKDDEVVEVPLRGLKAAGDSEGHAFHGNQWTAGQGDGRPKDGQVTQAGLDKRFPTAGDTVDGRKVLADVPNTGSISASLNDYEVLPGIREVQMSEFAKYTPSYSADIQKRTNELADQIKESKTISPLIVVVDKDQRGPYILEGSKRIDALAIIGAKSFPALVVIDTEDLKVLEGLRTLKPKSDLLVMRFDVKNPAVIDWATQHAAELVTQVADTTRDNIRAAIADLQESGDWADAYDSILSAVGDGARADLIARTETMLAANNGQRQAWDQAVDNGLLTGAERVVWIATEGACHECDALDGEERDIDGEYSGDGADGPPAHPNCRCTEGIVS